MLAVPGEDGCVYPGFCSFHAPPIETGCAQKGEEASLNIAFAGLSVNGMNKHLWKVSSFSFSELLISELIGLFNIFIF